jgi:UDP-N-acetylmuramoyl-L-alanyl-D-glutamate--2,6-diaminopimelate ligase
MFDPTLSDVVQVIHPDPGAIEGAIAAEYYQDPGKELYLIGITGTCGKTTTSFLAKYILDMAGGQTGLIGTVEYIIGSYRYQASRTTPDVCTMHKLLRDMVNQGCDAAVMEVSSHALDQNRVDKIEFDCGVFTNLSQDHLDYHQTMEAYLDAKKKLFRRSKKAVVNLDTPEGESILSTFSGPKLSYGIEKDADVRASDIRHTPQGTLFTLCYQEKSTVVTLPLVGKHNVYNALAASAIALQKGISLEKIASILATVPQVSGRLEMVPNVLGINIFVDFAHKEDALRKVMESLRDLNFRKLIVVFGCGGDRDRSKRPKMGRVCAELADVSIITNDNPRSENPQTIADEILVGFQEKPDSNYVVECQLLKM